MKSYRKAAAALLLALALATSAFAGEMQTGVASPQPTPTTNGEMHTGAPEGEIHTDGAGSTSGAADTVTGLALNLLESVFALF